MTPQEIQAEVNRLAPFHHKVALPHNLSTHVSELSRRPLEQTRLANLVKHAFPRLIEACGGSLAGKTVLDVACNCGGFSVEAARLNCASVLGIDIVPHYIEQANFMRRALELDQVEFKIMNIADIDQDMGTFDVTFFFGILYHLENPVDIMRRIASVTGQYILVDTSVLRLPKITQRLVPKSLWSMNIPERPSKEFKGIGTNQWRSESSVVEFYPTEDAVVDLLEFVGFTTVEKIEPTQKGLEKRYYTGDRVTYLASRA